ncbi:hypothetical protein niasHT_038563 [Heterodera trifolii]|uniref:DNA-directed DNA polymerase n=1 Tax=Heterodera trifolii TaxID=157864 RepID=A0ABD2I8A4_9BILA
MSQYSDDSLPPTLDGPYSPVGDDDNLMDEAPPLDEVMKRLPISDVPAEENERMARREPSITRELDAELFNGDGFVCLSAAQAEAGRFKAFRFIGQFLLSLTFGAVFPEEILRNLFTMCLNYAAEGAESMKLSADHFIFLLTSKHLDYEVAVHFKKIDNTATERILTRFEMVDQSNKSKERPSICEEPFVIDITAVQSKGAKPKMAGKGRCDFNVDYRIAAGATYELNNNDALCLFRAFELMRKKFVLPQQRFSEYKRDEAKQLEDVQTLCRASHIDANLPFYSVEEYGERIQAYYDVLHPGMFRLFCFDTFGKMKPAWKSVVNSYVQELCVVFTGDADGCAGHYNPIKAIGKFFSTKNYCFGCEMPYHTQAQHTSRCKWKCHNCQRVGRNFRGNCIEENGFFESCLSCNKTFKSQNCYEHHVSGTQCTVKRGNETITIEKSVCKSSKKCVDCGVIYQIRHHKQKEHVCGHKYCKICLGFHAPRDCYIPYRPKVKKEKRFVFFDFECTTDFKPDPQLMRFKHQVNFCFAHVTCTRCIEKGIWDQELDRACALCGRFRTYAWSPFEFWHTDVECRKVVEDPLAAFTKWLLNFETEVLGMEPGAKKRRKRKNAENTDGDAMEGEEDDDAVDEDAENNWMLGYDEAGEKPESVTTYAYAHAGSRYDHVLIYGEMLRMGVRPELIRQGNHLLEMKARKTGVYTTTIFRDSYKLIPIKLANFVKTFGLEIEGVDNKKYFPHKFNKADNYGTVLDTLPPMEDYYPGGLFPAERAKFEQWYDENREIGFELNEVIADYCKTDVQILAHGLVKMRQLFLSETRHDITDSVTIPSGCMKYWVQLAHYGKERVAIIPHLGYEKRGKQSTIARKYLKWRAEEELRENGRVLRHVESPGGEFKFGNYSLDGMMERPDEDKNLAIEVNGCYWHGCPSCFPDDAAIVGGGETAGALRARDAKRTRDIAREFEVEIIWECHLNAMLEDNPAMKAYFDNCPDSGPIDFHDAFFGGKRNMYTKYPVGHPTLVQFDKDVEWKCPAHIVGDDGIRLEGIIKCYAVPPRHCHYDIPVLPYRLTNRTLFPLCRTCSEMYPRGLIDPEYNCDHFDDAERGFSTTVTHIELEAALRSGYRVTHVYRAYIWRLACDWSDGLFHSYLLKFLKMKFEASGYPASCTEAGISEEESERRKQDHIDKAKQKDQVDLEADRIKHNPGLRYLSKLCLNSLWGRFALRNRLTKTEIVECHAELAKLLNDSKIEVSSIDQLTEKFWMVCYKAKDEHVVEHSTSNVAIALWTTSAARIHLLESLKKVYGPAPGVERYDTHILYMDTDSIFYEYLTRLGDPLPGGDQLGELADEYPNHTIMEFICAGPKAYGLWLRNNATGEDEYKIKVRGITLDSDACERITFEKMKDMVLNKLGQADNNIRFNYPTKNFKITKKGEIFTVPLVKQFNPTVNKGVIRDKGLRVVPFGYSDEEWCKWNCPGACSCLFNPDLNVNMFTEEELNDPDIMP